MDVVEEEAEEPEGLSFSLRPARYGEKQCQCHGEVLAILGHYGWLKTSQKVDHPATAKNRGHVWFHRRDVVAGIDLVEGDRVHFFLYADQDGLGAEELRFEHWGAEQCHGLPAAN